MVGSSIAGYRIEALLGCGSTATRYLARRDGGPCVALRLLHPEVAADDSLRESLLHQACAARRLSHPAAPGILDVVASSSSCAIATVLVEGESLAERLLRGGPEEDEALEILAELAEVMAEAHQREVPHGRIDPESVLIDAEGRVRLVDLGDLECAGAVCTAEGLCLLPLVEAFGARLRGAGPDPGPASAVLEVEPGELAARLADLRLARRATESRARLVTTVISAAAAGAAILVLASALPAARRIEPPAGASTLAVLPFRAAGLAPDPLPEGLALGLADSVITSLSDIESVLVRPTSAVERFGSYEIDPRAAGRALGVEAILTGEMATVSGGAEVRLRLQDVRTGAALWEETLRVDSGNDLLRLHRLVADLVRRRVAPPAPPTEAERA